MIESKLEKDLKKYAESLNWRYWKFVSPGNAGVPDRMLFKNGIILFFELKRKNKEPRKLQQIKIKDMKFCGLNVYVVDNIDRAKEIINSYENKIKECLLL